MSERTSAGAASPPRRISAANSANLLWKSQYGEPHGNIWNSCSALQPSSSIWGNQISGDVQLGEVYPHYSKQSSTQLATPQFNIGKLGSSTGLRGPSQRFTPASAMNAPLSSVNPLWLDDPYLVSPPPSPESSSATDSTPASTTNSSPFHSPIFASTSMASLAQEEFIISPTSGPLYFVQFKGSRIDVFTAPGTAVYNVGEAVMVDADRGRDLGTILAANVSRRDAASLKQRQSKDRQNALHTNGCGGSGGSSVLSSGSDNNSSGPTIYNPKQILGVASSSEISDMIAKINDESSAIALCNRKAGERHLDMKIVDAEYQWDRRKLTFFYTADTRVDFRDLVRELFRIYKTRIWMCATAARS